MKKLIIQTRLPIVLLLALLCSLMSGCHSTKNQPPLATETPAQMQQAIKNAASKYAKFRQSNPNIYNKAGQ
jgi:outer membrane lipoprotein-sorting protein